MTVSQRIVWLTISSGPELLFGDTFFLARVSYQVGKRCRGEQKIFGLSTTLKSKNRTREGVASSTQWRFGTVYYLTYSLPDLFLT